MAERGSSEKKAKRQAFLGSWQENLMWIGFVQPGAAEQGGSSSSRSTGASPGSTKRWVEEAAPQAHGESSSATDGLSVCCKDKLALACCPGPAGHSDDTPEAQSRGAGAAGGTAQQDRMGPGRGKARGGSAQPAESSAPARWWGGLGQHLPNLTAMCGNGLPSCGVDETEAIEAEHPPWRDVNPWRKSTVSGRDCMLCGATPLNDCCDEEVVRKEMILVKSKGTLRDGEQVFTDGDDMRTVF
eukprot:CAMPEP_0178373646 /NCGR_PEP_ID=MMETSP0689_2-20121128/1967_1 /TAXON_ID=160604 /ORGANISM="Amphidinium massartii, Strain CS-259" /LENGTH=241 /DNA_ID=CAMNT_0019993589 /DNA_START=12 /DNA_END=737 /DNA_ORIENTATION=+